MDYTQIILQPRLTEKSNLQSEGGVYTFNVHKTASKDVIKAAIEKLYNVKVVGVRTVVIKGYTRRTRAQREITVGEGKKAIVTLAEGNSIQLV